VTALAANIAALCDHTGPAASRAAGWPKWITYTDGEPDVAQLAAACYFDGVNFAPAIGAKGLMSMGFIDEVCPPSSVYTAFNAYKGPKQAVEKPLVAHQISPLWRELSQQFIDRELGVSSP
jgi:cephalosporin-C deacetylase-like acetyl esterase